MERIKWIDYSKVIGIYLVVLAHTNLFPPYKNGIYTFLMPVFFFISGFVFSFERNPTFKKFCAKRFNQLIVPYIWINIITYLFWLFIGRKVGTSNDMFILWYEPLINIIIGNGVGLVHNVPIWFFVCLFVVEMFYYLFFKKVKFPWVLWMIFIGIAYLNYTFNPYFLPFNINTAVVGIIFYSLGNLFAKSKYDFSTHPNILYIIISFGIVIIVSLINGRIAMYKNYYANYFLFLMGGLAGIIFILNICLYCSQWFGERKWIKYIARNTLIISGFHLLTFSFIKGCMVYIFQIPLSVLDEKIGVNILFSLISLILCLPLIYIINKYFPFIIGKKKTISLLSCQNLLHKLR